ncbi:MAG: hypothetical protein HYV29_09995 [Ignavibacteriales bacterium]|nr:hypothetical protein [Ignavibacteriales bacterium]
MKNKLVKAAATAIVFIVLQSVTFARSGNTNVKLHVNPRWKECSFQLDPALTQDAWHQFTNEAGLVVYFRPLTDAKPMGSGNYELSILQWQTAFNDADPAWNDTFVHPDSTHWLKESEQLGIPGLTLRSGITDNIDAGIYVTKSPGANYGFWGGQVQYNFINDAGNDWAASVGFNFVSLYGPEDFDFTVYGMDVLASKEFAVYSDWISVSPYAGVSAYLSNSHETTAAVNLHDETIAGVRGTIGAVTYISFAKIAVEFNAAAVNSLSLKIGFGF